MKTYQTWDSFSATMTWNRSDLWGQRYPLNRSKGNHFWGTKLWIQANVTLKIIHLQQPLIQYLICITKPKTPKMMGILLKFILTWWSLDPFRAKSKATKPKILQKIKKTIEFLHHSLVKLLGDVPIAISISSSKNLVRMRIVRWIEIVLMAELHQVSLPVGLPFFTRVLIDSRIKISEIHSLLGEVFTVPYPMIQVPSNEKTRDVSMFREPSRCHQMVD